MTGWERSPLNDEFLTGLAIHLLKSRRLGKGAGNDVLAISLPSLDHNGHEYGPRSFEVQDVLARLDVNLGLLLDAVEQQVGPDYVLGLSSDHGVATLPEQITAEGGDYLFTVKGNQLGLERDIAAGFGFEAGAKQIAAAFSP